MKKDDRILVIIGVLLLIIALSNYIFQLSQGQHWSKVLWFCKIATLIAAFGFISRNRLIINIILVSSIVAQTRWIVDFFLFLFGQGMGRNEWMSYGHPFMIITSVIMHSILIPLCFYGTYKLGFDKRCLKYSIILFAIFLLIISHFVTKEYLNLNCISYPCDYRHDDYLRISQGHDLYFSPYYLIYNMIFWTVGAIPSYLLMKYLFTKVKYLNKNNN
ncbi:hypothetical protein KY321_03660 [Candidatus Woesearchaeota archaeon]|nr:hypothetical protein [Candidatus Woesearchaeota archaeon]